MGFVWILVLAALVAAPVSLAPDAQATAAPALHCTNPPPPEDIDCDEVLDTQDNCPEVFNPDQANLDATYTTTEPAAYGGNEGTSMPAGDGDGDRCDADVDADGVANTSDNCRIQRNPRQEDADQDGVGDACSQDTDADGLSDGRDNCVKVANADQADLDADGTGDACDADIDGDAVLNGADNCPTTANREQQDRDGDGVGSACDPGEAAAVAPQDSTTSSNAGLGPGASDAVAPRLSVRIARVQRAWDVLGGMPASVRCSEACGLTAGVTLASRDARRLQLPRRLGDGTGLLGAAGRTWLFVTTPRRVARRLPRRGVRATLTIVATDQAGNRRTARRRITLRR